MYVVTSLWPRHPGLFALALGIKPESEALYPKYPNPYPYSPKPVTRIAPAGNETKYPN
jgi:hypothetical protein